MSAVVIAFPTEAVQSSFIEAWAAIPTSMKTRSESRAKVKKVWDDHAKRIGGHDVLLSALRAYLVGDKDLPKSGGPGLQVWLRAEKYDHWLTQAPNSVVSVQLADRGAFPDPEIRAKLVQALGSGFVISYLDPCTLEDGWLTPKTNYAREKLKEVSQVLKDAGLVGIRGKG